MNSDRRKHPRRSSDRPDALSARATRVFSGPVSPTPSAGATVRDGIFGGERRRRQRRRPATSWLWLAGFRRRYVDLDQILVGGTNLGSGSSGARRISVYGCSPGCLLISIIVSVILTIFLNILIRLF